MFQDEQAGGKSASTVSEFRAKFEKFGGPAGKAKPGSTGEWHWQNDWQNIFIFQMLRTKIMEVSILT